MLKYLITTTALFATPLTADALRVVADIPPLHSLTAQVMGDLGTPNSSHQQEHPPIITPCAPPRPHGCKMLIFWSG